MRRTILLPIAASVLHLIPTANALIGGTWSIHHGQAPDGLTDVTFPITILEVDHISGYNFAQNFSFLNSTGAGQIGLQPRPNSNDERTILRAVFSTSVPGSTSADAKHCTPRADGGPGVSCYVDWNGVYGRRYYLEVKYDSENGTWAGTVVDRTVARKPKRVHIGRYALPAGALGIAGSQVSIVEWLPWNVNEPVDHCAKLPFQRSKFGRPSTTSFTYFSDESYAFETGDCIGRVDFRTRLRDGVENSCGFRGQDGV